MVDVLPLVFVALGGFLVHLAIIAFAASQTASARRDLVSGELVVEWGSAYRAFPVILSLFWTALLIPLLILHPPTEKDVPALLGVILVGPGPVAGFLLVTHGTIYRLDDEEIRGRYWLRRRRIPWREVTRVSWSLGSFVVRSPNASLRINGGMNGLRDLAVAIRTRIPREVWADAESHLRKSEAAPP